MGWKSDYHFRRETGDSLVGYWLDSGKMVTKIPPTFTTRIISPICVIVHGRLFPKSGRARVRGNTAYITETMLERLF